MDHPAVGSVISGATTLEQLRALLGAAAKPPLPEDVLEEVEKVHCRYPNPTP